MKIQVTEEDIEVGVRKGSLMCPVALAVKRQVQTHLTISVRYSEILFWESRPWIGMLPLKEIKLPRFVGMRIRRYDKTGRMTPFEFEVEVE